MLVQIKPCDGATSPWSYVEWYDINATKVKFDLSSQINEHPLADKTTFKFSQYLHNTSKIIITGVLTVTCDIPGTTLEDKKNNFIEAAAIWWNQTSDIKDKTTNPQIKWRGWIQPMLIEKLDIEKVAGDSTEYQYSLECVINEGV